MMRALLILLALCGSAQSHSWYDFKCCAEGDCRQTTLGEVERQDNGWFVVTTGELIPFDDERIKVSLDPLIHRCVYTYATPATGKKIGDTRCLYVPEVAG